MIYVKPDVNQVSKPSQSSSGVIATEKGQTVGGVDGRASPFYSLIILIIEWSTALKLFGGSKQIQGDSYLRITDKNISTNKSFNILNYLMIFRLKKKTMICITEGKRSVFDLRNPLMS